MRVLIVGAGGVLGRRVARELLLRLPGVEPVLAGRRLPESEAPSQGEAVVLDAGDEEACLLALRGCDLAIACTGPLPRLALAKACARAGVSYVDVSDHPASCRAVESLGPAFAEKGRVASAGVGPCNAVSGALIDVAAPSFERIASVRCARWLDAAALGAHGRAGLSPVAGPTALLDFPFGDRQGWPLAPASWGGVPVENRVAFENELAGRLLRLPLLGRFARRLEAPGDRAAVRVELRGVAEGVQARASGFAYTAEDGLRLAALPVALAAEAILLGHEGRGWVPAHRLCGLADLERAGIRVDRPSVLPA